MIILFGSRLSREVRTRTLKTLTRKTAVTITKRIRHLCLSLWHTRKLKADPENLQKSITQLKQRYGYGSTSWGTELHGK